MDRDRERDRRPFPREDQYGTSRGQSYRPNRSPIPTDTYRAPRSPVRGGPFIDSYRAPIRGRTRSPPPFRRRSRSPPHFPPRGGDSYRGRARSPIPPRREFDRDASYRPPPRNFRDGPTFGNRSPLRAPPRDRSPLPLKRGRDISPAGSRGRRSPPPPAKRERLASPQRSRYNAYPTSREASPPRGRPYSPGPGPGPAGPRRLTPPRGVTRGYRPASRSPLRRNEHNDPRKVEWRRRSPSPQRQNRPDLITGETSGTQSVTSSRRSSPPIHPSRLAVIEPEDRVSRPPPLGPREDAPPRPMYRARSPPQHRPRSPAPMRARSPPPSPRSPPGKRESPPPRERDVPPTGPRIPPTGPAGYDSGNRGGPSYKDALPARAPPTGPGGSRSYAQTATDAPIPTGPRPSAISPPTQPRGAPPPGRGGYRGDYQSRGRGGPYGATSWRGGRGGGAPPSPFIRDQEFTSGPPPGPPLGPRSSFSQGPGFRPNAAPPSTNFQRTSRFGPNNGPIPSGPRADMAAPSGFNENGRKPSNPHLADLPRIIEGGQKAPDLYDRSRVDRLENEAESLRRAIDEKQMKKRKGLREWERMGRESEAAAFRAQLAEDGARALAGEGEGGAAF
ncbi:hypothetical protein AAFC00_005258 [Neodothiora populina]|uniref:Serine/arginine repetitive matrix protein 1 n=1 Tax=Neodothiora populina TaxID=2781224 RepID=A0ABR3PKB1_9PEZI